MLAEVSAAAAKTVCCGCERFALGHGFPAFNSCRNSFQATNLARHKSLFLASIERRRAFIAAQF
jgi:hypothetical protein